MKIPDLETMKAMIAVTFGGNGDMDIASDYDLVAGKRRDDFSFRPRFPRFVVYGRDHWYYREYIELLTDEGEFCVEDDI